MLPGLQTDDYVLVNKIAYLFHTPERGDVIVFHYPLDTSEDFIKRVIGLPGDTVTLDNKTVQVDGVVLHEPYISEAYNPSGKTIKVPMDEYFVLGDNRPLSDDSRDWGFVPKADLVGKAVIVYWPLSNWELINTYSNVYTQVKVSH